MRKSISLFENNNIVYPTNMKVPVLLHTQLFVTEKIVLPEKHCQCEFCCIVKCSSLISFLYMKEVLRTEC